MSRRLSADDAPSENTRSDAMPNPTASNQARAPRATSGGSASIVVAPLLGVGLRVGLRVGLVVGLVVLHSIYQVVLLVRAVGATVRNARRGQVRSGVASFASLQEVLDAHACASSAVRVPRHLAVVFGDAEPGWMRLCVWSMWLWLGGGMTAKPEVWREWRRRYQQQMDARYAHDVASIVHLARIGGVQQLSVYTSQRVSESTLEALRTNLHVAYKTRAVFGSQQDKQDKQDKQGMQDMQDMQCANGWARYTALKRRVGKQSDSSVDSVAASHESSDSDEAAPSSVDETLASSYTTEPDRLQRATDDATVEMHMGLTTACPNTTHAEAHASLTPASCLQVTLVSRDDGHARFAQIVSSHICCTAAQYFDDVLVRDMHTAASAAPKRGFAPSSLRRSWVAKRQALASQLTVARLDGVLAHAGYLREPELLVVLRSPARVRRLYGFPAWSLRLTDLFYDADMPAHRSYTSAHFVAALRKLAKTEQRYGR